MNLKGLALSVGAFAPALFGELPFQPVHETATCLRASGVPGEFVRSGAVAVHVTRADRAGITRGPALRAEGIVQCAQVAGRPNGAGVLAIVADTGTRREVRTYRRDPATGWSDDPQRVLTLPGATDQRLAVAAADDGTALIAASELTEHGQARVIAVLRAAPTSAADGSSAAGPITLFSGSSPAEAPPTVAAGMSAAGEPVVAWAVLRRAGAERELWAGPLARPARLGHVTPGGSLALAVAEDGSALLAYPDRGAMWVRERAPGGAFGAAERIGPAGRVPPAAALRTDGSAVVAWVDDDGTRESVRSGRGAFATRTLAPGSEFPPSPAKVATSWARYLRAGGENGWSDEASDNDAGNPRAIFVPDGRPLVAWGADRYVNGVWPSEGFAALARETSPFGLGARMVGSVTPLVLADGTPAVAWTDDDPNLLDGRVHVAVAGVPQPADPAPPRVRVVASAHNTLAFTCSAACDVRAQVVGIPDADAVVSLTRAGTKRVRIVSNLRTIPARFRLRLFSAARGARTARHRTVTVERD